MSFFSYVWPSAVKTGSIIRQCVIGQTYCGLISPPSSASTPEEPTESPEPSRRLGGRLDDDAASGKAGAASGEGGASAGAAAASADAASGWLATICRSRSIISPASDAVRGAASRPSLSDTSPSVPAPPSPAVSSPDVAVVAAAGSAAAGTGAATADDDG